MNAPVTAADEALKEQADRTGPATRQTSARCERERPLSRAALDDLARQGDIDGPVFEAALQEIGTRPGREDWVRYWVHLLTLCGALLLAAGVIFFIAWNWNGMHRFIKFGILEGLVAAGVIVAAWRGVDGIAGATALLAAGLCLGPLLAVYGQTYMSGAHLWELFRAWTCMLLPFAALGRQAGLWLLVWLTAGIWGLEYAQSMSSSGEFTYGLPEFILLQMAAVGAWELALSRSQGVPGREWLRAPWLPRLMVLAVSAALTLLVVMLIRDGGLPPEGGTLLLPFRPSILGAYAAGLAAVYCRYRRKRPDLFMLGCGVFSVCTVFIALLVEAGIFLNKDAGSMLFWGVTVAGLTALCGKLLLFWHRAMEAEGKAAASGPARHFFGPARPSTDWPELEATLVRKGLWPEGKGLPVPPPSAAPWYVGTMLSAGGWISALLLMAALGFLLYSTLDIRGNGEGPLFIGGAVFLGIGALCSRLPGVFARQFGLASAIAGALAASAALVVLTHSVRYWSLPCLTVCLVSFFLIRNLAYRYIATVFGLFFLYSLFDAVIRGSYPDFLDFSFRGGEAALESGTIPLVWIMAVFWTGLCALLALVWQQESRWMTDRRLAPAMPPLLHGIYTSMILLLTASLIAQSAHDLSWLARLLPPRASIGLGAACGFLLLVFLLGREQGKGPLRGTGRERGQCTVQARSGAVLYRLSLACAAATLPMGWYLPGVPVALFGFLVSRRTGNKVLLGASALFLCAYLFHYYYALDLLLLDKSFILTVCGLVLLVAATVLRRLCAGREEPERPDEERREVRNA